MKHATLETKGTKIRLIRDELAKCEKAPFCLANAFFKKSKWEGNEKTRDFFKNKCYPQSHFKHLRNVSYTRLGNPFNKN